MKIKFSAGISSFFQIVICRILFDICYRCIISPIYAYSGFTMEAAQNQYLLSWIVFLSFAPLIAWINANAKRMSDFAMLVLYLLAFIPFTTLAGSKGFPSNFVIYTVIFWAMLSLFYLLFTFESRVKVVAKHDFTKECYGLVFAGLLCLVTLVVLFVSGYYRHFTVTFHLSEVYEIRAMARDYGLPKILSYLLSMASPIILLTALYMFYIKKRFIAVCLICVQLLNFGIAEHKNILFMLIIGIGVYFYYDRLLKGKFIHWLNVLLSASVLEYVCFGSFKLASVFVRRACFVTSNLSFCYFDFFTTHTPDYFAQSFLRHFGVVSKYPKIAFMISDVYFNQPEMVSNNGLVADAITNYGIVGAVVLPLILATILKIFDKATKKLPAKIYVVVAISMAISLQNTFLMTCIFTHGFLIMLIWLCVFSKLLEKNGKMLECEQNAG